MGKLKVCYLKIEQAHKRDREDCTESWAKCRPVLKIPAAGVSFRRTDRGKDIKGSLREKVRLEFCLEERLGLR